MVIPARLNKNGGTAPVLIQQIIKCVKGNRGKQGLN
jgi:hypothetical protein